MEGLTMKLSNKQEAFCREYLIDLNGTQAAIRAGYSHKGAHVQAAQLLSNHKVSEYLQQLMNERAERVQRSADDVLRDIQAVKQSCMRELPDPQGNLVMVDSKAALKALELEGKHLKMFTERVEASVSGSLQIQIINEFA
jgi:phage terminase small subunit